MEVVPKGSDFSEKQHHECLRHTAIIQSSPLPPAVDERATVELPERGRSHG